MERSSVRTIALLGAALLCLAAAPSLPAPGELFVAHRSLGVWRSILSYGQEEPDRVAARAFEELRSLFALSTRVRDSFDSERKRQLVEFVRQLGTMDLDRVLEEEHPLFYTAPNGERVMRFHGYWHEGNYQVHIGPLPIPEPAPALGNIRSEVAFRRNPRAEDLVRLRAAGTLDAGPLLFREALGSWELFYRLMDLERIRSEDWLEGFKLTPMIASQDLDTDDRQYLAQFLATAPQTFAIFENLGRIRDVVNAGPGGTTRIHYVYSLDLKALEDRYPRDYHDAKFFLENVSFRLTFRTEEGLDLGRISWSHTERRFTFDATVDAGAIIPTDGSGMPAGAPIRPSQLSAMRYRADVDADASFLGLDFHLRDTRLQHSYLAKQDERGGGPREAVLELQWNQPPEVRVTGALLYVIPPWLIDLLMPGTIEQRFREFAARMAAANGGRGFVASLGFVEQEGRQRVHGELSVELPYGLLQPILGEVLQREFDPFSPTAGAEDRRILDDFVGAMRADLSRLIPEPARLEPSRRPSFLPNQNLRHRE